MDSIASRAAAVLARHPAPALRLTSLLELLDRDGPRLYVNAEALRRILERYPHTFRFLDPWRGPWGQTRDRADGGPGSGEPWVVIVRDPGGGVSPPPGLVKMRESVRWLAAGVDPRSPLQVARAHGLVLAEGEARDVLRRAA